MAITLLNTVNDNTVGEWFLWLGGPSQLFCKGTPDGGAVTIQLSNDAGTTAYSAKFTDGTDFTVAGADFPDTFPVSEWAQGVYVRATLAGGGTVVGVSVTLQQV